MISLKKIPHFWMWYEYQLECKPHQVDSAMQQKKEIIIRGPIFIIIFESSRLHKQ